MQPPRRGSPKCCFSRGVARSNFCRPSPPHGRTALFAAFVHVAGMKLILRGATAASSRRQSSVGSVALRLPGMAMVLSRFAFSQDKGSDCAQRTSGTMIKIRAPVGCAETRVSHENLFGQFSRIFDHGFSEFPGSANAVHSSARSGDSGALPRAEARVHSRGY